MRLAANAVTWLATGGDINDVKYVVVWKLTASARACKLLAVTSFEPPMAAVAGHVIGIGVPAGIFDLN